MTQNLSIPLLIRPWLGGREGHQVRQVGDLKEKLKLASHLNWCFSTGDSWWTDFPTVCGSAGLEGQEHNPSSTLPGTALWIQPKSAGHLKGESSCSTHICLVPCLQLASIGSDCCICVQIKLTSTTASICCSGFSATSMRIDVDIKYFTVRIQNRLSSLCIYATVHHAVAAVLCNAH